VRLFLLLLDIKRSFITFYIHFIFFCALDMLRHRNYFKKFISYFLENTLNVKRPSLHFNLTITELRVYHDFPSTRSRGKRDSLFLSRSFPEHVSLTFRRLSCDIVQIDIEKLSLIVNVKYPRWNEDKKRRSFESISFRQYILARR